MKAKALISQFGVTITSVIKGFIALKILVQFGDHDYAMLSQFFVMSMFVVQLLSLNFSAPLVSSLTNHPQNHRVAFNATTHLMVLNLFLIAIISLVFPNLISGFIWGEVSFVMLGLLLVYVFALSGNNVSLLCFQAAKQFTVYSRLQILQQMLQLLALGLGLWQDNVVLLVIFAIFFEFLLWGVGWKYKKVFSLSMTQIQLSRTWLKSHWSVAWPLFIAFGMIWGLNNYGRFLVVQQLDLNALAAYAATFSIAMLSGLMINPICTVFFPYMSENSGRDLSAARSLISGLTIFLCATASFGFILTSTTWVLMKLVARDDLFAGFPFVACVCAAQMAYGAARLANLSTVVRNRTLHGSLAFLFGLFLSVVFGVFWLCPDYGILGIAISYFIGCAVSMSVIFVDVLPFAKSCYAQFGLTRFVSFVLLSFVLPFCGMWIPMLSITQIFFFIPLILFLYLGSTLYLLKDQDYLERLLKKIKLPGGRIA